MAVKRLHFDIETYSSVDLRSSGAYKYVESVDFEILLLAYAIDDAPVVIVDLANGEQMPQEFIDCLLDPGVVKCAHNATFERNAFKQYGYNIPIDQWICTAVKAAYCGLPISLELVSKALNLGEFGKLSTGKALIRYFCMPCKPTKANDKRQRNLPKHDPEKWEEFKLYAINDVVAEREIDRILSIYPMHEFEHLNYIIDQEINDTGVKIDTEFVNNAVRMDNKFEASTIDRAREITNVDNPNSPAQLKEWLSDALGKNVQSLAKDKVIALRDETSNEVVREVLDIRLMLAKSSTKKYTAMLNCLCYDGRAHGLFQFLGANRTGRWAGRLIQLQNLPQNHMKDLAHARSVIRSGDYDLALMLYESIPNVLSELIRTAIVAPEGYTFAVSDFSAIEARILSWVAGEDWRMEVFKTHGKIYESSASLMFGVPMDQIDKGSELRQRGKIAELALGYQGSVGAMTAMDKGGKIPEHEKKPLVDKWRKANPKIVKLWYDVENCAIHTIKSKKSIRLGCLGFHCDENVFRIELPSGRSLFYNKPGIGTNRWGNPSIIFKGMDQVIKQWTTIETYGGKLVENIIQAISRDLLAYSMQRLRQEGFKMVMHVHDEIICEVLDNDSSNQLERMNNIMSEDVPWAPGLPLRADGYVTPFYKKD